MANGWILTANGSGLKDNSLASNGAHPRGTRTDGDARKWTLHRSTSDPGARPGRRRTPPPIKKTIWEGPSSGFGARRLRWAPASAGRRGTRPRPTTLGAAWNAITVCPRMERASAVEGRERAADADGAGHADGGAHAPLLAAGAAQRGAAGAGRPPRARATLGRAAGGVPGLGG